MTVAYGVPGLLANALAALDGKYRIVVVDNSSSERVRAVATAAGARYIDPGSNLGFAAGVNRALNEIDLSKTDVLLLNPDAVVAPEAIEHLRVQLAGDRGLACIAPQQRRHDSAIEDRVAWPFPTPLGAWIDAVGLGRTRRRPEFVIGAVLLIRGDALIDVGGFDERFFLYAEETDWQLRARRLGWTVTVCEGVWASHLGAAADADTSRRELRFHAGAERYVRKHHGRAGWLSYRLASLSGATVRAIVLNGTRRRGAAERAWIYARGPDRLARKAGVVPPPVPRVPALSRHRPLTDFRGAGRVASPSKPPLRILLDARDVGISQKGVGRVLEELVPRLLNLDPDRYIAVATSAAKARLAEVDSDKLKTVRLLPQSAWEQLVLPSIALRLGVDATYCHRECAAIWGPPVLLHVTEDPEVRWARESDPPARERLRRLYSRVFMDRALQRARVVTSSDSTRSDLVRRHGLRCEQISVVPLGVDLRRFTASSSGGREGSYFFCLGSADPRDHCELVLEAFARFRAESGEATGLVMAGDLGSQATRVHELSQRLGVGAFVDLPGRITDEQLSAYSANSVATVCASAYEGFGLQPLEALACGALLISARTASVEEVARGAVVLWTDLEIGALAAALSTARSSESLRENAAKTNPAVAARFDWSTTATKLDEILEECALAGQGRRERRRSVKPTDCLWP